MFDNFTQWVQEKIDGIDEDLKMDKWHKDRAEKGENPFAIPFGDKNAGWVQSIKERKVAYIIIRDRLKIPGMDVYKISDWLKAEELKRRGGEEIAFGDAYAHI